MMKKKSTGVSGLDKLPEVNGRVRIKHLNIKGTVVYIAKEYLFANHMYPIQVKLDQPYDDSGQTMYRTNLKEIVKLKKKTTKKKKVSFDDEIFMF